MRLTSVFIPYPVHPDLDPYVSLLGSRIPGRGWLSAPISQTGVRSLEPLAWGRGGRRGRQASTHPPGGIEVAFGQGLVVIGIRIRKGPLSHDAAGEPAEEGQERSRVEPGLGAGTRSRRRARRQPLPRGRTPAHGGAARTRDGGGRGSQPRGKKGARFPPTSHAHEWGAQQTMWPALLFCGPRHPRSADNNRLGAFTAHFL